jgi:hypothetical protein
VSARVGHDEGEDADMKTKLTAETVKKAIEDGKPASMTQLSHLLGYRGSVSSSVTRKFRALVPDIGGLLAANGPTRGKPGEAGRKAKSASKRRWPRDPRNVFRPGSAYATCYDILAAHKDGLPREKLVALQAKATGKDLTHAGYDVQVVCSAWGNDEGLSRNDGPRNRNCQNGFWVQRTNGHVKLMVD